MAGSQMGMSRPRKVRKLVRGHTEGTHSGPMFFFRHSNVIQAERQGSRTGGPEDERTPKPLVINNPSWPIPLGNTSTVLPWAMGRVSQTVVRPLQFTI